jgi:hypothetical protein
MEVLADLEKKGRDAAAKNVTAAAEAKKRKGGGTAKVTTKRQTVGVVAEVAIESSSSCSSTAGSNSVGFKPVIEVPLEVLAATLVPEPSAANPLPSLLGKDSSDAEVPLD